MSSNPQQVFNAQQITTQQQTTPLYPSPPHIFPLVGKPPKESFTISLDDASETVRLQSQRIARLEERYDLLIKHYQRLEQNQQYKEQEIKNWQVRCNTLQAHLTNPYNRIDQLQYEYNEVTNDWQRMQYLIKTGMEDQKSLELLQQQKQNDVTFWKEKTRNTERMHINIKSFQDKIRLLQLENQRLQKIVVQHSNNSNKENIKWANV